MTRLLLRSWERTVRRHGEKRAVVEAVSGRTVTFRELDKLSREWLDRHANVALDGATVLFSLSNGIGWLTLFLALVRAGAVIVPLDAGEPSAAQRALAEGLRAHFWWDGERLVALSQSKRRTRGEISFIKLTSGSTGVPRALHFRDRELLADAKQVTATMGISARDLNYALIPFGHSYGLGNLTLPLLAQGVPLVCGTSPLPHAIAADFARWQPTVFPGVPAMWRALASSDVTLKSLRLGITAGAPLPVSVALDFFRRFGQRLHSLYGSSETGGITYDRTGKATLAGGVGRAVRGVTLRLVGPSRLEVSSAAVVTQGNRRQRKKQGAWIMADAITLDAGGQVMVLGRRGRTVKIAGRRINLEEITTRLRRIDGVKDAWAVASSENEPTLGAILVTDLTTADLRTALQADTAAWKIPKKWRMVSALPLTPRGKPDSSAMRSMLF